MRRAALESSRIKSRARVDVCANAFSRVSSFRRDVRLRAKERFGSVDREKNGRELSLSFKVSRIVSPKDDEE